MMAAVGKEEKEVKRGNKELANAKMVGEALGLAAEEAKETEQERAVEQEPKVGEEQEAGQEPEPEERQEMKQYIYIGPNIPGLTTYTVIEGKGKYPIHIKKFVKECAAVGKLFVPVAQLTVAEPKTKTKGALEHRNYTKVLEYLANGKKGE